MSDSSKTISQSDFDELYRKYRHQFTLVSRMYVRDEMAAEDIVAESFLAFWERRDTIAADNIPGYILTSVKNRSLQWLRDRRKHMEVHHTMHSVACRQITQQIGLLETTLPDTVLFQEVSSIIEATLRQMPERTRSVFVAHRLKDMSYVEIEQLYNLSNGQVNDHLQRAKKTFILALRDYMPMVILFLLFF